MLNNFKEFIIRGNVVDLSVGVIMGAAFTGIVNSFVTDILMPPIGKLSADIDFSNFFVNLSDGHYPTLKAAKEAGAVTINYGRFITELVHFTLVAFAVFLLVHSINKFRRQQDARPKPVPRMEVLMQEMCEHLKCIAKRE